MVKAGDIVRSKDEVDLPRKRIARPCVSTSSRAISNARRRGGQERPQGNRPAAKSRQNPAVARRSLLATAR